MATPKQNKIDPYYIDIYKQVEQLKKDVEVLKGKEITTNDLPMSSLKKNLEQTWNADGNMLLAKGSVKVGAMGVLPACRVLKTGGPQAVAANTLTTITFDTETVSTTCFDTMDMFSTAISTSRIYAPASGIYTATAWIRTNVAAGVTTASSGYAQIRDKNSAILGRTRLNTYNTGVNQFNPCISTEVYLQKGDYVFVDLAATDALTVYGLGESISGGGFSAFSLVWKSSMPGA